MITVAWTDYRIERLKKLWAEGYSCSQIASRIGGTRNSVIGKVHRLGLEGRAPQRSHEFAGAYNKKRSKRHWIKRKPNKQQFTFGTVSALLPCPNRAPGAPQPPCQSPPALPPLNIPLIETTRGQCKFIAGNDGLTCGHPVLAESVYCPAHHAACYILLTKRKREMEAA